MSCAETANLSREEKTNEEKTEGGRAGFDYS